MNDSSGLVNDLPVFIQNWYSAGAMYSTASDLSKFSEALFSYKLIKKETLELMLQPGLEDYGFGLWIYVVKFRLTKLDLRIQHLRIGLVISLLNERNHKNVTKHKS